jgi:hypothetical protein
MAELDRAMALAEGMKAARMVLLGLGDGEEEEESAPRQGRSDV